jgi:uncharacterized protein YdaU (DUF1376 family)
MSKLPAFLLYAADFIVGTAEMSLAETGAFILLLCHQWDKGTLPAEAEKLARLVHAGSEEERQAVNEVLKKFAANKNGLQNRRLEDVRSVQQEYRKRRTQAAKKAAGVRWGKPEPEVANTTTQLTLNVSPQQQKLENEMMQFFGFNKQGHADKAPTIRQFLQTLWSNGNSEHFTRQWVAYVGYKQSSGTPLHSFARYIGNATKNYTDGAWNAENWQQKLARQIQKHENTKTNQPAATGKRKQYSTQGSPIIQPGKTSV